MTIQRTDPSEFKEVEKLAAQIWREHYTPIIGADQVEYMLDKFQSEQAMLAQEAEGYEYYCFRLEGNLVGYLCIKQEQDLLFVSKIYVSDQMRGKGLGRKGLNFVEVETRKRGLLKIRLTVNKNNVNSIKTYEKLGYKKNKEIIIDIGNGYVMDDYEMIKVLH